MNVLLMLLLVVSFGTGWVAAWLGLTEFGLHKYVSIALVLVALWHLAIHSRAMLAQLRQIRATPVRTRASLGSLNPISTETESITSAVSTTLH